MADLDIILSEYAQFEDSLRKVMSGICAPHCCACRRVCCREELCRETIESPFLCLLHQKIPAAVRLLFSKRLADPQRLRPTHR